MKREDQEHRLAWRPTKCRRFTSEHRAKSRRACSSRCVRSLRSIAFTSRQENQRKSRCTLPRASSSTGPRKMEVDHRQRQTHRQRWRLVTQPPAQPVHRLIHIPHSTMPEPQLRHCYLMVVILQPTAVCAADERSRRTCISQCQPSHEPPCPIQGAVSSRLGWETKTLNPAVIPSEAEGPASTAPAQPRTLGAPSMTQLHRVMGGKPKPSTPRSSRAKPRDLHLQHQPSHEPWVPHP